MTTVKPHKHSEMIKVWADNPGTVFQFSSGFNAGGGWTDIIDPCWTENHEYRVKPQPIPDIVLSGFTTIHEGSIGFYAFSAVHLNQDNLKLIFDGETGKLKSAEVTNIKD